MEKITKSSDSILIDPNEPLILPDGTALVGRVEWFLYALCCLDYQNLPTPMSRIEEFANALITGEIPNIEPQSRAEKFFLAILDGNVSDLPRPQSRSEVLLDKLARGEFDLSDVEPIQSRYELLLAYLIKNGGIGNIDYVLYEFSEEMKTMYNTVEKPFKSLELSGNTKVNVLQESVEDDVIVPYQVDECQGATLTGTKETGSLDNLVINGRTLVNSVLEDTSNSDYVSFDQDYEGQSFTINGTNEGAIKSAILKGQTLVNLFQDMDYVWNNLTKQDSFNYNGDLIILNNGYRDGRYWDSVPKIPNIKSNTEYTMIFTKGSSPYVEFGTIDKNGQTSALKRFTNAQKLKITSPNNGDLRVKFCIENPTSDKSAINLGKVMFIEGDYTNVDIPYFEGMQSVKMPVLNSIGKNLLNITPNTLERITINGSTGVITESNTRCTTKYIKATPKDDLFLKRFNTNYKVAVRYYYNDMLVNRTLNGNGNFISDGNLKVDSSDYYNQIRLIFVKSDDSEITPQEVSSQQIMLTSSQNDVFEPYKSNILTVNEDVELRGFDSVEDTLNLNTGEYTKRIGELTLNGSEYWQYAKNDDGTIRFNLPISDLKDYGTSSDGKNLINNKHPKAYFSTSGNTYGVSTWRNHVVFFTEHTNVNDFKQWLSQNPTTIQYELETPIIKTVDLNVVDQNNTKIDKIHVFNETTHVNASSDELTPTVNIGKSVSYPTIIKPNTKYTVDLKRNDKPLTVNLGGTEVTFASGETRKTITTPSTSTNDKLSYYGMGQKCSDIMVLEGEVEGSIDYFTGTQSVKAPTVSTVGKNVVNEKIWKIEAEEEGYQCLLSAGWATNVDKSGNPIIIPVHVEKDKVYTLKCKNKATKHFNDFYFMDDLLNGKVKSFRRSVGKNSTLNSFVDTIITFTADRDYKYLQIDTGNSDANGYIVKNTLQLEEGSIATPYEPYKSTILSCDEDVELCSSPNGVYKDYINIPTHKLFKTNNVVTVNGSENWTMYSLNDEYPNTVGFYYTHNNSLNSVEGGLQLLVDGGILKWFENERFPGIINTSEEGIGLIDNKYIKVSVLKSRLETVDVNGFKKWLTNNPITVQYVTNPTVKTINISIIDQDNVVQSKLHTFNDTTHIMTSSDELTPIIKCDGKLEYPVIIKPSTQYTILANTNANGHASNNIAFDLGGARVTNTFDTRKITVTTPSTLVNNSLTITGEGAKVSELMVLEGNESDTLPYFEGMSSCKMPILHTVGKNLFDKEAFYNDWKSKVDTYVYKEIVDNEEVLKINNFYHLFNDNDGFRINVKKGVPLTFRMECKKAGTESTNSVFTIRYGDNIYESFPICRSDEWQTATTTFVPTRDYITICSGYNNDGYYYVKNIQLEVGSVTTSYEPHKSSILSLPEEIVLRGIKGAKDTYNTRTGEYVKRIGEILVDGSNDEAWRDCTPTNDSVISFLLVLDGKENSANFTNNKMINKPTWDANVEGIWADCNIILTFKRSTLTTNDLTGARQWLSQNPIAVQYELETPIIKTVDLNVVDQNGNTIPKIKSYNGVTHLEVTVPKQSLLPHISAEVATDNSKDMSSLTTKHQEISEAQSAIKDNIQSQSDEIDIALMATTEIFESILE